MNKYALLSLAFVLSVVTLSACRSDTTDTATADHNTMEAEDLLDGQLSSTPPGEDILGDDVVPHYGLDAQEHLTDDYLDDYGYDDDYGHDDTYDDDHDGTVEFGIPLDDMLDNAYVHDTDGNLNDGENARHDDFFH